MHIYVLEQQPGISPWHEGLTVQQNAAEAARYTQILLKNGVLEPAHHITLEMTNAILQHIQLISLKLIV